MTMLALVDYGAGNLASVRRGLEAAGAAALHTITAARDLEGASAVVIPGVGHFGATRALDAEWRAAIHRLLTTGAPLLGICLGMQWLFSGSDEAPGITGLGIIAGRCSRLEASAGTKVPHVGWNTVKVRSGSRLLGGVPDGNHVYFTHSYAAPVTAECVAAATHGTTFAAAVESGNAYGVQFHPEKSGDTGLRILRNFMEIARAG